MEIQFWYSDILPNTFIRNSVEKIDSTILFKNIYTDKIDLTKLNFLVFSLETEWTYPKNKEIAHTHSVEFIELLIKLQDKNFYFILEKQLKWKILFFISINNHYVNENNNQNYIILIILFKNDIIIT